MASLFFEIFIWIMHILAKTKLSGSKQVMPVTFLHQEKRRPGFLALSYEVMSSQNVFFSGKGLFESPILIFSLPTIWFPTWSIVMWDISTQHCVVRKYGAPERSDLLKEWEQNEHQWSSFKFLWDPGLQSAWAEPSEVPALFPVLACCNVFFSLLCCSISTAMLHIQA